MTREGHPAPITKALIKNVQREAKNLYVLPAEAMRVPWEQLLCTIAIDVGTGIRKPDQPRPLLRGEIILQQHRIEQITDSADLDEVDSTERYPPLCRLHP